MPLTFSAERPVTPPAELIGRVTGQFDDHDGHAFDTWGRKHLLQLERGLRVTGREFSDFDRMLDFGCGPGRFLRHLGPLSDDVELHGIDIDDDAISWARRHIDYVRFSVGPHEPPTEYADGTFDLVLNHSVFSHLDERYQNLWLAELQRVTRADAVLLLTFHGTRNWNIVRRQHEGAGEDLEPRQSELESKGIVFYDDDAYIGSSHPSFYHSTFHAPWYIFEHWAAFFDLTAYLPSGSLDQDLVVLRRRADDEVADQPVGRRSDSVPVRAPTPAVSSDVRDQIGRTVGSWPPAQTVLGRAKRRALRYERERQDRVNEQLAVALEQTRADVKALEADAHPDPTRQLAMLNESLYEQGLRISALAREFRDRLDATAPGANGSDR